MNGEIMMLTKTDDSYSAFTASAIPAAELSRAANRAVADVSPWAGQYLDWYQVDAASLFAQFVTAAPSVLKPQRTLQHVGN
jgi:hypothetical protein